MKTKTPQSNAGIMKNTTKQCRNGKKNTQNTVRIIKKHHKLCFSLFLRCVVEFLFSFLHCVVVFFITFTLFCGVFHNSCIVLWCFRFYSYIVLCFSLFLHCLGMKATTPHNNVGIIEKYHKTM
jgi:hypothetical protein